MKKRNRVLPANLRKKESWLGKKVLMVTFFVFAAMVFGVFSFDLDNASRMDEFILEEPAPRSYFAPFNLAYIDKGKTEALLLEKSETVPKVYSVSKNINKQISEGVDSFFIIMDRAQKIEEPEKSKKELENLPFQIPEASIEYLLSEKKLDEARKHLEFFLIYALPKGFMEHRFRSKLIQENVKEFLFINNETSEKELRSFESILTIEQIRNNVSDIASNRISERRFKNAVLQIFHEAVWENLILDAKKSEELKEKMLASIPPIEKHIKRNELIIQRGLRVDAEARERLEKIAKKLAGQRIKKEFLASGLLVLAIYFISLIYFYNFETKILYSANKLLLFHVTIFITLVFCKIVTLWPGFSIYLMPAALASILLTLLLNYRIGIWSALMMTLLIGPLSGYRAEEMIAVLLTSIIGTFAVVGIRKRIHFLRVGFLMGLASFFVILGFRIFQEFSLQETSILASLGFINSILITIPLCFMLLPLLESIFGLVTDITLLELSDLNHPLMKKMILEAPGTYHHSLVVSSLAESACESIGANSLLARVGCYFHDIGKTIRPEFFTENQDRPYMNKHENLAPLASCQIIINHVTKGVELAKKFKLKDPILDFIPEHHGTGIVYYFYRKAKDQAKPEDNIRVENYRYPGPRPQSRETAVSLLADSAEAASRTLREPSPETIKELVKKIINDKFVDGQLDECDLTLRDLHRIQESFARNLMAMFHTRINYPSKESPVEDPDLFKENQFSKFRVDS